MKGASRATGRRVVRNAKHGSVRPPSRMKVLRGEPSQFEKELILTMVQQERALARGNCYVTAEALYHLVGGKKAGWKPMVMRHLGDSHWFIKHESGLVLDPVAGGLWGPQDQPDYSQARGCGFLTKNASKRTAQMMLAMVYGIPFATNLEMEREFRRGADHGYSR